MSIDSKCSVDIRRIGSVYEIVGVQPDLPGVPVGSTFREWKALEEAIFEDCQRRMIGPCGISFTVSLPLEGDVRDETYREWLRAAGLEFVPEPDLEEHLQERQEVWKGKFSIFQDNPE